MHRFRDMFGLRGGGKMFRCPIGRNCLISVIVGFVAGLLMAFFLPPMAIAVVECVLILILCILLKRR